MIEKWIGDADKKVDMFVRYEDVIRIIECFIDHEKTMYLLQFSNV